MATLSPPITFQSSVTLLSSTCILMNGRSWVRGRKVCFGQLSPKQASSMLPACASNNAKADLVCASWNWKHFQLTGVNGVGLVGLISKSHAKKIVVNAGSSCWMSANELSSMDIKWRDWSLFTITCLMHVFKDHIGLCTGGTCNHCLNSIALKEFLKLDSGKFGSFVMKMDEGSRVVRARSGQRCKWQSGFRYLKGQSTQAS
jgi:hypothetical protein